MPSVNITTVTGRGVIMVSVKCGLLQVSWKYNLVHCSGTTSLFLSLTQYATSEFRLVPMGQLTWLCSHNFDDAPSQMGFTAHLFKSWSQLCNLAIKVLFHPDWFQLVPTTRQDSSARSWILCARNVPLPARDQWQAVRRAGWQAAGTDKVTLLECFLSHGQKVSLSSSESECFLKYEVKSTNLWNKNCLCFRLKWQLLEITSHCHLRSFF